MTTRRGKHWKDEPHPTQPGKRVYVARSGMNYQPDPVGSPDLWEECAPGFIDEGDKWSSIKQQLPIEIDKITGNGVKLNLPNGGNVFIKPKNFNIPSGITSTSDKIILHDLWNSVDLEIVPTNGRVKMWYILKDITAQTLFEWEITSTGAYSLQEQLDGDGNVYVLDGDEPIIRFMVPTLVVNDDFRRGYFDVSKQGNKYNLGVAMPSLVGATYPIRVDPTIDANPSNNDGSIGVSTPAFSYLTFPALRNFVTGTPGYYSSSTYSNYPSVVVRAQGPTDSSWDFLNRIVLPAFDTSGIPVDNVVESATLTAKLWSLAVSLQLAGFTDPTKLACVCEFTGPTNFTPNHYQSFGDVDFGSANPWDYTPAVDYVTWTLNSAGCSAINKGGSTSLGIRWYDDQYDLTPLTPKGAGSWAFTIYEQEHPTEDIVLSIVYGPPKTRVTNITKSTSIRKIIIP